MFLQQLIKKIKKQARALSFAAFSLVISSVGASFAHAGFGTSLMQTAPVLAPGAFEVKGQADIIFNRGGGFNISPHLRAGVIEHYLDVEGFFGAGTTDFQAGGKAKFNLLPDVPGQVGLAFLGGLSYLRDEDLNALLLSFAGLVSKQFHAEFGEVSPYAALELEPYFGAVDTHLPISISTGARWDLPKQAPWVFYSEFQFNLKDSNWGLSAGAGYYF